MTEGLHEKVSKVPMSNKIALLTKAVKEASDDTTEVNKGHRFESKQK